MLRYLLQHEFAVFQYKTGIYFPYYFSKCRRVMFNTFHFAAGAHTKHITRISNLNLRFSFLKNAVL